MRLKHAVIRGHYWYDNDIVCLFGHFAISIQNPLNTEIWRRAPIELASPHALRVLKDHRQLVVLDNLLEQCAVNVSTLERLLITAPTVNVASLFKPLFKELNVGHVLNVTKYEWHLHIEVVVDIGVNEEIGERLVNWHQDYLLALFEQALDVVERCCVDVEAADGPTHQFVEVVNKRLHTQNADA